MVLDIYNDESDYILILILISYIYDYISIVYNILNI